MAITTFIEQFTRTPSRQNAATYSEDMDVRLSEENSRIIQMNEQAAQANTQAALLNSQIVQTTTNAATATEQAAIVTQKALEADTAKNQAVTKANEILGYVIPSGTAKSIDQSNTDRTAMSKAAFNAIASNNRDKFGGSGIVEHGKHYISAVSSNINEGIYVASNLSNTVKIGHSSGVGVSKTNYPIFNANGVLSNIKNIGITFTDENYILLPPAPTVLPYTATLTAEQIASGVIKHADASNSGLILNGKATTDTSGWTAVNGTIASVGSKLEITNGTGTQAYAYNSFATVIGKAYTLEIENTDGTSLTNIIRAGTGATGLQYANLSNIASGTRSVITFIATTTSSTITLYTGSSVTGETAFFDNIAVFPADAISRTDFVYFKTNDVDLATVDFAYPLGLKQYLGVDVDGLTGISVGAYAGALTASLFGTWQASGALVGKGYVWSTRTETQRKLFLSNPENNCYLDGDKVRQVQGLMQVAMMKGDNFTEATAFASLGYTQDTVDKGLWRHADGSLAIGIALVHRRNQGGYHPVYNSNGSGKFRNTNTGYYSWFQSSDWVFDSIAKMFDFSSDPLRVVGGSIASTHSGRADGIFYDQVHEGDITDLRNSSHKIEDYSRLIDREFNKAVSGVVRGSQGELNTEVKTQTTTGTVATVEVNDGTKYKSGDVIYIYDLTAGTVKGRFVVKSIATNTVTVQTAFAKLANSYMISGGSTTRTKSNTITISDMIGSPSNLPTAMKIDGQSFNTLHTAEDGTSLLPTGTTGSDGIAVFKLSRDANATPLRVLKSTDSGLTWTALTVTTHYTFSTTTNAITFTAGNIPLATDLVMVTYQSHTSMAVPAVNSEALAIGDVLTSNSSASNWGSFLTSSLSGKVQTNTSQPFMVSNKLSQFTVESTNKLSTTGTFPVINNQITIGGTTTAVKVFPYLTRSNGKAYLQLVFKEMKYTTSWGDDAKFNIVDNVSTTVDNNGQTVLIGTKQIPLPYFIGASE